MSTDVARPATGREIPALSDGIRVEDLIDSSRNSVALRVLSDPEIYDLELRHLFTRAWVAVAHASEVSKPGDFVSRSIGEDPVIVTRRSADEINVFLNVCSHRGMKLCRTDLGSQKSFQCPYHGWTYDGSGALKGVPGWRDMYGASFDKSDFDLPRARVAVYAGMVFATWDVDAPTLEDYLGDFRWYLDLTFNRSAGGMKVVGPPQRWTIKSNWKLAAEQFSGDGYHNVMLHRSMADLGMFETDLKGLNLFGVNVTANGHGLRAFEFGEVWAEAAAASGGEPWDAATKFAVMPPACMDAPMLEDIEQRLTPGQLRVLTDNAPFVGNVFPNLAFLIATIPMPGGELGPVISWRVWQPAGPDATEVMAWALVEADAPEELQERTRLTTIRTFSDSGIFEQDDAEAWAGIQMSTRGAISRQRTLNYQSQLGEVRPDNWEGGGLVQSGISRDDNQWAFWKRYRDFMTGHPWADGEASR
jgi:phenylpropionate dioxygenase-like ring-hydroxylating dioxygenase large terminal subunit